jgi:Zn-finger nucleic acid-binding protein
MSELELGNGFRYFACPACDRGWVERAEWAQLVEAPTPGAPAREACPVCSQPLRDGRLGHTPLLACAEHGIWLARAALEPLMVELIEAARHGGCPACAGHFADVLALGFRYLRCKKCKACFVGAEAFAGLLREIAADTAGPALGELRPGDRACPECTLTMATGVLARERIDVCGVHGTFFDAHELSRALARHAGLSG